MKKPLPVKIVEALGWTYVALAVSLVFRAVIGVGSVPMSPSDHFLECLCSLVPITLSVGMLVFLRHGRRGWFIVPNTMLLLLLVAVLILDLLGHATVGLAIASVVSLLFLIAPLVLLYLPSSGLWFKAKTEESAGSSGGLFGLIGCATVFAALAVFGLLLYDVVVFVLIIVAAL